MSLNCCPICGGNHLKGVLTLEGIPVFVNVHAESGAKAKTFPQGTQDLVQCLDCGFVFNRKFEPEKVIYDTNYHAERGCSSYYLRHIKHIVNFIEAARPLHDKFILEVACGSGEFLQETVTRGPQKAIGVDPSAFGETDGTLIMHRTLFNKAYLKSMDRPVDILISRHMIEHILDPVGMLGLFNQALAEGGMLYLETPRLDWILENKAFFDFPYEHCAYFSDSVMERMLKACGFEIIARENSYGGQYFSICAKKCGGQVSIEPAHGEKVAQEQARFSALLDTYLAINQAKKVRGFCTETLVSVMPDTKPATLSHHGLYLWGASAKGVMCANLLDQWPIAGLIDKNAYKQGTFIPGTGHQVLSPSEITYEHVKTIIVENDVYQEEIQREVRKIDPRILVYSLSALIQGVS